MVGCQSRTLGSSHSGLLVEGSPRFNLERDRDRRRDRFFKPRNTRNTRKKRDLAAEGRPNRMECNNANGTYIYLHLLLPFPPSPIPSFSPSLVFPFASLRLCAFAFSVFCFLFSVFCFAPLRFLSSVFSDFSLQQISTAVGRSPWPNPSRDRRRPKWLPGGRLRSQHGRCWDQRSR